MKKFVCLLLLTIFILAQHAYAAERDARNFRGATYEAKVVNCNEWISLRYAPSVYSEVLTRIPLGTIVTVYDGSVWGIDGFYPVEYNGFRGYCLKDYLEYHSGGGAPIRR